MSVGRPGEPYLENPTWWLYFPAIVQRGTQQCPGAQCVDHRHPPVPRRGPLRLHGAAPPRAQSREAQSGSGSPDQSVTGAAATNEKQASRPLPALAAMHLGACSSEVTLYSRAGAGCLGVREVGAKLRASDITHHVVETDGNFSEPKPLTCRIVMPFLHKSDGI